MADQTLAPSAASYFPMMTQLMMKPPLTSSVAPAAFGAASAMPPQAAAPAPPAPARAPLYMPPSADQYFQMQTHLAPPLTNSVAPAAFGAAPAYVPPYVPAVGTPRMAGYVPPQGTPPAAAPAPVVNPVASLTPRQSAYRAPAPLAGPPTPEQQQAMSDRQAIMGAAGGAGNGFARIGAAAADVVSLPARAVMGAANTLLRVPNAFGAGIPYIPEEAFGGSSSSMTPYYDRYVRANQPAGAPSSGGIVASANAAENSPAAASQSPNSQSAASNPGDYDITKITPVAANITPAKGQAFVAGLPDYAPPQQRTVGQSPTIGADGQWDVPPLPPGMAGDEGGTDDPNLPPLWRPAQTVGIPTRFGEAAPVSSGNAFLDSVMGYVRGGGNGFEQASRARQMAPMINAYAAMHGSDVSAGASNYGADRRLEGDYANVNGMTSREIIAQAEKRAEFEATPITTGARPNGMGPFYPNLPEYAMPTIGGMPRPVGATAERQAQKQNIVDGTHHTFQGVDYEWRNGQWSPAK